MAEKLTADGAYRALPLSLRSMVVGTCPEIDNWFRWLRERIVDEVHAEIEPQVMKERRERDELKKDRDTLAARVKELEAATAKPAPKPRHTGGQKVRDWLENHVGHLDHRINDEAFEAFAKEHGIPDDPEPPSDAELMRRASEASDGSTSAYWSQCAAEFLRLLAERDGGEA